MTTDNQELIEQFHLMWNGFPGLARLIDSHHTVLAANPVAQAKGFEAGCTCAKVGDPSIHKGCKLAQMFKTGEAVTDNVLPDRIRGWMPVSGRDDVCVHFAVMLPEE